MKKVLFINPLQSHCGVFQYGTRMFSILEMSERLIAQYTNVDETPMDIPGLSHYDVIIYNVHPGISNWMSAAPFAGLKARQIGIYHDGGFDRPFDTWLFSDSSAPGFGNVRTIGRPLPKWEPVTTLPNKRLTVGLSGLVGAWAETMVTTVLNQMPTALIRLHLPSSDHCDPYGDIAKSVGSRCIQMGEPGQITAEREFFTEYALCEWLSENDLNCYIRTPAACSGISSALDMALAVKRPVAINSHPMFRHITRLTPEICIENSHLANILVMGNEPLNQHRKRNSREVVLGELEQILLE
jgi:hypothetical protein